MKPSKQHRWNVKLPCKRTALYLLNAENQHTLYTKNILFSNFFVYFNYVNACSQFLTSRKIIKGAKYRRGENFRTAKTPSEEIYQRAAKLPVTIFLRVVFIFQVFDVVIYANWKNNFLKLLLIKLPEVFITIATISVINLLLSYCTALIVYNFKDSLELICKICYCCLLVNACRLPGLLNIITEQSTNFAQSFLYVEKR